MSKHSESIHTNATSSANELYEQLLQNGRKRASYSVHNAQHKSNLRTLMLVSVALLAGATMAIMQYY